MDFVADVGGVDVLLLITCGTIALMGYKTPYQKIIIILLLEFIFLISYETYMYSKPLSKINLVAAVQEIDFHTTKILLQCIAAAALIWAGSVILPFIAVLIVGYLTYIILSINYAISIGTYVPGVFPQNYSTVMAIFCLLQLVAAVFGVLNGYGLLDGFRNSFVHFWGSLANRVGFRPHKRA